MKLHCLGTVGYHPCQSRHTSCYFLPELGIQLDAGTGTFRVGELLQSESLDVCISHAHLDHIVGLTYFLGLTSQTCLKHIRVHGEVRHLAAIRRCLFDAALFPASVPIQWCAWSEPAKRQMGDTCMEFFPLSHPGGCWGFRFEAQGRSIAYITDTTAGPDSEYLDHVRDVDLLIHECNFPDSMESFAQSTGHSCLSQVLDLAVRAEVKRLLLVHFSPYADKDDPVRLEEKLGTLSQRLPFPIEVAHDQLVVEF